MKKSITKRKIIEALQKENLERGYFFEMEKGTYRKNCAVCAVGAILRHMSFEKWAQKINGDLDSLGKTVTHHIYTSDEYDPRLVQEGNYLGALSCFFESGATRSECIAFVKEHFPAKLTVTVSAASIR